MFCADHVFVMAGKKKLQFLQPLAAELEKREDLPDLVMTAKLKVREGRDIRDIW